MTTANPTMTTAAASQPPLKERILRAGSWTVFAYGGTLVLRLGSSLILTRLLAPEAFGLITIVVTIGVVASLLSDIGLRQAVVHSKHGDEPLMLNTAWTMQIVRGFLVWSLCCLTALGLYAAGQMGWLSDHSVYASPQLPLLLTLGTLTSLAQGFESTKRFTADRRIDQKRVVLIELSAMFINISTAIALSWLTRSVWAIVVGGFVAAVYSAIAGHLWLRGLRNRLAWDRDFARQIFSYGKWVLASSLLFVLANNGDKLLLGVWVAPALLGCFAIGQNLAQVLELAVGRVFMQVAAPAFADVIRTSPDRLREVYLRMRLPVDLLFVSAAGFMFAIGPWLVGLLYDPRYAEAGAILRILSFALIFARYGVSSSAYLALHAPKAPAVMQFVRVLVFFTAVPLAYSKFGVQGAFWAIALHPVAMVPVVWWFDRHFGIASWRHEFLTLLAWPVGWAAGTLLIGAAGWLLH
jgi:O-antigen/teichoic acid export membrane protein